jgi:hypothetical protein
MGRARNSSHAIASTRRQTSVTAVHDGFADIFGDLRSSSERAAVGTELLLGPVYASGLPFQIRLRLDDDMPLSDDPGGLHITIWRKYGAREEWGLIRRWPATALLTRLQHRPPVLINHMRPRAVLAGPAKIEACAWLIHALGNTVSSA